MDEKFNNENTLSKAVRHENEDACAKNNSYDNTDVTSCTVNTTATNVTASATVHESAPVNAQILHAKLWNKILKTILPKLETERKYPNPDVPEFYPRNATSYLNSDQKNVTRKTTTPESWSTTKCIIYNTHNNTSLKNDLVLMSQQCFAAARTANVNLKTIVDPSSDFVNGITQYYWTFNNARYYRMPKVITYRSNQLKIEIPSVDRSAESTSSNHLQTGLAKKDEQLLHLNNVVKALLKEIWRINELLTNHKNKEQLNNDITFAIEELLKPSSELRFHCDDCSDKFKRVVIKIFKQQEHKIAKQQAECKDVFIDYLFSIIENSLEAFNKCGLVKYNFRATLAKHDAATQTDHIGLDVQRNPYRRLHPCKYKQQMTKIFRNRNFCKVFDVKSNDGLDSTNWYSASMSSTSFFSRYQHQNNRNRNRSIKRIHRNAYLSQMCRTTSSVAIQQPSFYESQITNPIQLIHQKYKNLSCRLESLPNENLVKFSYIVNGKEYSAVASTKKEAQYHCAWHVLGATKYK